MVGTQTGTSRDLPGSDGDNDQAGQLDCIAESLNRQPPFCVLEDSSLLRWQGQHPAKRRRWIFSFHHALP